MKPEDIVRKVILTELITLYRAPSQVQNAEQGAIYQDAIIRAVAGFKASEQELCNVWETFKQTWTRTTWPSPGDLCQAISTHRKQHWKPNIYKPPPVEDRTTTTEDEVAFQDCMRRLRANPGDFFKGRELLAMGERIERRGW